MKRVELQDLGVIEYKACLEYQQSLFDALLKAKAEHSESDNIGQLLLVEHPAVYTLGKSAKEENILFGEEFLRQTGAELFHTNRGGDVTFHGLGQVVGYPIIDIEALGLGLHDYIDALEQAVINTVAEFGIKAGRIAGASGVWIIEEGRPPRKICAIGVRASRFVVMHGFALNVATDLSFFTHINPCGFIDRGVTSIEKEVGHKVEPERVKELIVKFLSEILNVKIYKN